MRWERKIKICLKYFKLKTITILTVLALFYSCDRGFEEMNEDPHAYSEADPNTLFTTSIIRTVGTGTADRNRTNIKYLSGAVQYLSTLNDFWYGEKGIVNVQSGNFFETVYQEHLKSLVEVIDFTEDNPDLINENAIAKIWRVYTLHRVTDAYGNVPYNEASLGSIDEAFKPKYDDQSDIYPWMLKDLESAINEMDPSLNSFGSADVIYGGDLESWKIFGYSLMLRLAMRLTKVAPSLSEEWVKKAIAGGVMQSNDDIALLEHSPGDGNTWNWDARELKRESLPEGDKGKGLVKMSTTFLDLLRNNEDPRIPFYMTLWEGNIESKQNSIIVETTMPDLQKGLPNGYDQGTISSVIPGFSSDELMEISEPNTATVANLSSPSIILSYSEIEFLLAEASLRGWADGNPEEHYQKAIEANMESSSLFPNSDLLGITEIEIQNYISSHPLEGSFEEQMRRIHTQFYLAHYMYFDFFEAWSNWRRTGVPKLAPINYALNSTAGEPIRRLMYSSQEKSLNGENLDEAISEQGPDSYSTRIWWDKED